MLDNHVEFDITQGDKSKNKKNDQEKNVHGD